MTYLRQPRGAVVRYALGGDPTILQGPTSTGMRTDPLASILSLISNAVVPDAITCDATGTTCTGTGAYATLFTLLNQLLNQAQIQAHSLSFNGKTWAYTGPSIPETNQVTNLKTLLSMQTLETSGIPGVPPVYTIGTANPGGVQQTHTYMVANNAQAVVSALQGWLGVVPMQTATTLLDSGSGTTPPVVTQTAGVLCPDGSRAASLDLCPMSGPAVTGSGNYICPDGSAVASANLCPASLAPVAVSAPATISSLMKNPLFLLGAAGAAYLLFFRKSS